MAEWWENDKPVQQPAGGDAWWANDKPAGNNPATKFDQHIEAASKKYDIPVPWLKSQIQAESNFNPVAVSPAGARGLMQLMPETAKELGVQDPFNPGQNIDAGARYMRKLLDASQGGIEEALAKYNWGMGNVQRKGLKNMPKETRDYIAKVTKGAGVPWYGKLIKGMADPLAGAAQLAAAIPDPIGDYLYEKAGMDNPRETVPAALKAEEKQYQQNRKDAGDTGFDWTRTAGNIVSPASLAVGSGTQIPALAHGAGRVGLQAALSGGAEAALQPTYGDDFAKDKAVQVGTGAALGPLFAGASHALLGIGGKTAGIVRGKVQPKAKEIMDLGKQFDVPVTASDMGGGKVAARSEAVLERVPIIGIDRQAQQSAAQAAGQKITDRLGKEFADASFQSLDRIRQVAAGGGPRAGRAQELLRMVENADGSWQKVIQASGNLRAFRMQLGADQLYDDVSRLAGNKLVPVEGTLKKLGELEGQLGQDKLRDVGTLRIIQQLQSSLDNPEMPNSHGMLRRLDSKLSALIRGERTGENEVVSSEGARVLTQIRDSLREDMDKFANSVPDLAAANRRAADFYKTKVAPYKAKDLAKALGAEDADNVYRTFLGEGPDSAKRLYNALDEKGRAAVRYGIVADGMKAAVNEAADEFKPTRFAQQIRKNGHALGVYFKGEQLAQVQGYAKLMDHLQRASKSQTSSDFATYNIVPAGMGASLVDPLGAGATVFGTAAAAKFLLTTKVGQRIVFAANLLKSGTPAMQKLASEANEKLMEAGVEATTGGVAPRISDAINRQAPVAGGAIAGQGMSTEQQQPGRKLP